MLEERKKVQMLEGYEETGGKTTVSDKLCCTYCGKPGNEEKTCFQKHGRSNVSKADNSVSRGPKVGSV